MNESNQAVSRRKWFAGAGTVGVAAAAASLLPGVKPAPEPVVEAVPVPQNGGGYRLSEHVKRYYKTTLV